jgi:hypothetical protein
VTLCVCPHRFPQRLSTSVGIGSRGYPPLGTTAWGRTVDNVGTLDLGTIASSVAWRSHGIPPPRGAAGGRAERAGRGEPVDDLARSGLVCWMTQSRAARSVLDRDVAVDAARTGWRSGAERAATAHTPLQRPSGDGVRSAPEVHTHRGRGCRVTGWGAAPGSVSRAGGVAAACGAAGRSGPEMHTPVGWGRTGASAGGRGRPGVGS